MNKVTLSKLIGDTGIFIDGDWVESKDQDLSGDVRLIQLADIGDGYFIDKSSRFLTSEKARELKCTFLQQGDLLIARMPDPLGRACIFPELNMPCVTVVDVCIIRPDEKIANINWLKYLINSNDFRNKIIKYIKGTTRQRISRGNLEKISFLLPSLTDQFHIANQLNKAENLIAQRKECIRLLDEFLKSTFLEMFGDPVKNQKGWNIGKFIDLATLDRKQVLPSGFTKEDFYIGLEDIEKETGKIIKTLSVNAEDLKSSKFRFTPSHILYAKLRPYLNKVALPYQSGICSTDIFPVLPLEGKSNRFFICYLMRSKPFVTEMHSQSSGTNLPRASASVIENFKTYQPPIELQTQFAQIVEKTEALKAQYQQSFQELENLYGSLSKQAFKGELIAK